MKIQIANWLASVARTSGDLVVRITHIDVSLLPTYQQLKNRVTAAQPQLIAISKKTAADVTAVQPHADVWVNDGKELNVLTLYVLTDAIAATDAMTIQMTKGFTDIITVSDSIPIFSFIKELAETVTASDLISIGMTKELAEIVTASDSISIAMTKELAEAVTASDSISIAMTKELIEIVTASDSFWIGTTKELAEIVTASESISIGMTKELIDSTTATDSGVLVIQDYCDFTYFAEDYVGISRTF